MYSLTARTMYTSCVAVQHLCMCYPLLYCTRFFFPEEKHACIREDNCIEGTYMQEGLA